MGKSTYLQKKTLSDALSGGAYVTLYRNSPGDDDEGDEVTGYTRMVANFTEPDRKKALMMSQNSNDVIFPPKPGGYGTVTHVGLRDAAVDGNLLYYTQLPKPLRSTDEGITFKSGDLKVSED